MNMFSDIATEETVKSIVQYVAKELKVHPAGAETREALKKVGRFALTRFEWSAPDWAKEYERLFKEK